MTETEWMECDDLRAMLDAVRESMSDRKAQLFAFACYHRIRRFMPWSVWELDALEAYIDGEKKLIELEPLFPGGRLEGDGYSVGPIATLFTSGETFVGAVAEGLREAIRGHAAWAAARATSINAAWALTYLTTEPNETTYEHSVFAAERTVQRKLLRCIMGGPSGVPAHKLTLAEGQQDIVRNLAQEIYDQRAFDRLPVLADALEEAGVTDATVLGHCRSDSPHTRGCWPVDLILGR